MEKGLQPRVLKKTNQFISFKFGNVQMFDIMNFIDGATTLDSFLKAYECSETKGFFLYEWFDCPSKLDNEQLPSYTDFFSRLRNQNLLEALNKKFKNLLLNGYTKKDALREMEICSAPPTGTENYSHLQDVWESQNMRMFKDLLRWYKNKDVIPSLDAVQKMMKFHHYCGIGMLKLGCTLPNIANMSTLFDKILPIH